MKKIFKYISSIVLVTSIIISGIPATVLAEEQSIRISSPKEWVEFAKKCKTDAYSKGVKVELLKDLYY